MPLPPESNEPQPDPSPTVVDPVATGPYVPPPPGAADSPGGVTPTAEAVGSGGSAVPERAGRYPVLGEIGRGGMGAVLRGRDPDLNRDLAVKVLLEQHQHDPELVRRFLEEAQITGQLQHPGVVPVHEVGRLPDRRPFFTMKLVRGQTLADLLLARKGPGDDLPRFLAVFEQVCQTMAYAHSKGVIHRDLKPSNVMVGAFGEVQVMDWGLAKVLPAERPAEVVAPTEEITGIQTVRTTTPGTSSYDGSVLGTPAFMAPEQARGALDQIDERCDVFGLGALLCVILTGRPPYEGPMRSDYYRQALKGELAEARARLERSGADAELVKLALACLAAAPAERPRNAGEVAEAVTAYRSGVQERLRAAELARAAAQARAAEERKARRLSRAVLTLVLALVLLGGVGWRWLERERSQRQAERLAETTREVNEALDEATLWRGRARVAAVTDLTPWAGALRAAERAEGLLQGGDVQADLRERVENLLRDLREDYWEARRKAGAAKKDQEMLQRLADIRSQAGDEFDPGSADADYARAFTAYGIDVQALPADEAAARLRARPPAVAIELAAALDAWALERWHGKQPPARWRRLLEVARLTDPDDWRNRLRAAAGEKDPGTLRRLAAEADPAALPPASAQLLGMALTAAGDAHAAAAWLRKAHARHPGDVWINYHLAEALVREQPPRWDEAVRFYTAARAARPEIAHALAHALEQQGKREEAIAVFEQLTRLRPDDAGHHNCLSRAYLLAGRADEAVRAGLRALDIQPGLASAHVNLGNALAHQGRHDEAAQHYRRAADLAPDSPKGYLNLGNSFFRRKRIDEALAAYRDALAVQPNSAVALYGIGLCLAEKDQTEEAVRHYRRAVELDPGLVRAHVNLGSALYTLGRLDEAAAACETALRHKPDDAFALYNLGWARLKQGRTEQALDAFRRAVARQPDLAAAQHGLGEALYKRGDLAAAIAAFRKSLELRPEHAETHVDLARALLTAGQPEEALAAVERALELQPGLAAAHNNLGVIQVRRGRLNQAAASFRKAAELKPDYAQAHYNLGNVLARQGQPAEAARAYHRALKIQPAFVEARVNLGNVLVQQNQFADAILEYHRALADRPRSVPAHHNLAKALAAQGLTEDAMREYRRALDLQPDYFESHLNLGLLLLARRRPYDALPHFRKAAALRPADANAHYNLGLALLKTGDLDGALASLRKAIELDPRHASAYVALGSVLQSRGEFRDALAAFERARAELKSDDPRQAAVGQLIRYCRGMAELDRKLTAVLQGEVLPAGDEERVSLARLCHQFKHLYGTAVRFWEEAFAGTPALADNLAAGHRYYAARSAALAGCGGGADAARFDDKQRERWRKQALDWLRADLQLWQRKLDGDATAGGQVQKALEGWQSSPDLAGLRDRGALARLPEAEAEAWLQLWADVDGLLGRARGVKGP
jgi:serine/threonine-protein kinase